MPVCAALPDVTLRRSKRSGRRVERSGRRLMIHANLVESSVFFGVAALTLLLVMLLYAVITADPQEAARTEASLMQSPAVAPPPLPVRGAQAFAPAVLPAETGRPAGAFLFLIAGLALAVVGGGMFFGTGHGVTVCTNQALAICSDGFVVLHAAQLLGGALAIGGIGLVSTAIVLALR